MKIFISDLHISSPLFKKDKEIINLINNKDVEEVFILGDILDTWEENSYTTAIDSKKDFIYEINQCEKIKLILIGNHDPEINIMKEIFPNTIITDKHAMDLFGKKVILVHGNEFDISSSYLKYFFFIHYIGERIGMNVKGYFRNIYYNNLLKKRGLTNDDIVIDIEKKLVAFYTGDFDLVICGHTHIPKIVKTESIIYANCGSCISTPSYIRADNNILSLIKL